MNKLCIYFIYTGTYLQEICTLTMEFYCSICYNRPVKGVCLWNYVRKLRKEIF